MTNLQERIDNLRKQANFKQPTQNVEQPKTSQMIEAEIKNDYDQFIIPGFKVLEQFEIEQSLIEIRDQILKEGIIIKRPENFEQYRTRAEYFAENTFTKKNIKFISEERLRFETQYDSDREYLLNPGDLKTQNKNCHFKEPRKTATLMFFGIDKSTFFEVSESTEETERGRIINKTSSCIGPAKMQIIISSDGTSIKITSGKFNICPVAKYWYFKNETTILVDKKPAEEINESIKEIFAKICYDQLLSEQKLQKYYQSKQKL